MVDDDWVKWCKVINHGLIPVVAGICAIFDDWRTLAIPNGNDNDSDPIPCDINGWDWLISSSRKYSF